MSDEGKLCEREAVCPVCMHHCRLKPGQTGICRGRKNAEGEIISVNYGKLTALAMDPVEKKPLRRFYPGTSVLSVGSYGCNLRCPFCQNFEISMDGGSSTVWEAKPAWLAQRAFDAADSGCIGVAYTYNEPLIGWEFVRDTAMEVRKRGLKNVVVTNGSVTEEVLLEVLPYIDAMNIDLKGFTEAYYRKLGGDLDTVRRFIRLAVKNCHVELTTLIVPGENDSKEEIKELSSWIASLSRDIPLHVSRFFPRCRMADRAPTSVDAVYRLAKTASEALNYVYTGNC